jgi:hypothetical protein
MEDWRSIWFARELLNEGLWWRAEKMEDKFVFGKISGYPKIFIVMLEPYEEDSVRKPR